MRCLWDASKMWLFLIFFLAAVNSISCIHLREGSILSHGDWTTDHRISVPLYVGPRTFFFGIGQYNYFIQELQDNGRLGVELSHGNLDYWIIQAFGVKINGIQYLCYIDNYKYYTINRVSLDGNLVQIDYGYWGSAPDLIFPLNVNHKHYIYSVSGYYWSIREVSSLGKLLEETDKGSWNYYYAVGFSYSILGRQYIYCAGTIGWFIQEILPNGKMGQETDHVGVDPNHVLAFPLEIHDKHYFYSISNSDRDWYVRELLPGGKMGDYKARGVNSNSYTVMFSYKSHDNLYIYGVGNYHYFTKQLHEVPEFVPRIHDQNEVCPSDSSSASVSCGCEDDGQCTDVNTFNTELNGLNERRPRRDTDDRGIIRPNFVEAYLGDIIINDAYVTSYFNDSNNPVLSYSVVPTPPDNPSEDPILLTVGIDAEIHRRHLRRSRHPISFDVRYHLIDLNRHPDDDAGHLLADSLGGSPDPWNFAPQSPMVNRRVNVAGSIIPQQGWYEVERLIREFIRTTRGFVRWSLAIVYGNMPNSRRPTDFLLSTRFYDANGDAINGLDYAYETVYHFRNVPTVACRGVMDPWWNLPY